MSITSNTQEVKVVNLSGHNMSHRNTLTGNVGTLIPILTEEVIPNTRCHLKTSFSVKMPPLACCDQWFKDNDNESNSQLVKRGDEHAKGCDQWFKDNDNESNSQLANIDYRIEACCDQWFKDNDNESNSQQALQRRSGRAVL